MVALMAAARRESSVICTRLHLTADGEPREVGRAIEEALDESCARYRFPRPAVALSLRGPGLRFW
jgi:diaminopimelate decarboxylase